MINSRPAKIASHQILAGLCAKLCAMLSYTTPVSNRLAPFVSISFDAEFCGLFYEWWEMVSCCVASNFTNEVERNELQLAPCKRLVAPVTGRSCSSRQSVTYDCYNFLLLRYRNYAHLLVVLCYYICSGSICSLMESQNLLQRTSTRYSSFRVVINIFPVLRREILNHVIGLASIQKLHAMVIMSVRKQLG